MCAGRSWKRLRPEADRPDSHCSYEFWSGIQGLGLKTPSGGRFEKARLFINFQTAFAGSFLRRPIRELFPHQDSRGFAQGGHLYPLERREAAQRARTARHGLMGMREIARIRGESEQDGMARRAIAPSSIALRFPRRLLRAPASSFSKAYSRSAAPENRPISAASQRADNSSADWSQSGAGVPSVARKSE